MPILSEDYTKMVVLDTKTGKEIAVITNEVITTAQDSIVVKLTPRYDQCSVSLGGQESLP